MSWAPLQRHSLKTRIGLGTLCIFLLGLWSLSFHASQMLRADMQRFLGDQQMATISMLASHINGELENRLTGLGKIAASTATAMQRSPAATQEALGDRPMLQMLFNGGAMAYDAMGSLLAQVPQSSFTGSALADTALVQAALEQGKALIGKPLASAEGKAPAITMAAPIRDATGKVIGALAGVTDLATPNFLNVIIANNYGKTGGYLLIDPQQRLIVTATDRRRIMERLPAPGAISPIDRTLGSPDESGVMINSNGEEVLKSDKRIPATGWILAATLPTAEAFAPIREMQRRMLFATLLLTLLAGGVTWWLLRRQLSPLLTTVEKLSTRKRMEEALRQREHYQRALLDNFPFMVWLKDEESRFLAVNKALADTVGWPSTEALIGKTDLDIAPADLAECYRADDRAVLASGHSKQVEEIIETGGERRWFETYKSPVTLDGRIIGTVGFARDITSSKQHKAMLIAARAEAERANRAKSRFLAAASHDLRQPLSALSLYVGVLKGIAAPDSSELVDNIQSCVNSLSELLTDLLDVSKLDAGVVEPRHSDFAIDELLATLVSVHSAEAALKGLDLRLRPSGRHARTDPQLLRRIVGNLIANAIHYTDKGGILVACRRVHGTHWIEIRDTGIGIPAEKTDYIFEEFTQLGDDARNKGSGLGLAIVAKSAALLDLRIRVRSWPGRGSLFAIELPAGTATISAETAPCPAPPEALHIGLVEDNPLHLQALVVALENAGHTVAAATTSRELLEKLGSAIPDVIVSDYRLAAAETGFDVIEKARDVHGDTLPAILITGDTDPVLIQSMARRGIAVHYKPLHIDALLAYIREAREGKAL